MPKIKHTFLKQDQKESGQKISNVSRPSNFRLDIHRDTQEVVRFLALDQSSRRAVRIAIRFLAMRRVPGPLNVLRGYSGRHSSLPGDGDKQGTPVSNVIAPFFASL